MIRIRRPLLASAVVVAALLAAASASAQQTVVYVVRHAERASEEPDSPLSDAGRARAATLARLLADVPLASVSSTDTRRTRDTAAPVAAAHGLDVALYDPDGAEALVARLSGTPGHHLVVGHSNTVPDLVRRFGGEPLGEIRSDEYDRVYVVIPAMDREGSPSALLRFGAESPGGSGALLEVAGHQGGLRPGGAPQR